MPTNRSRRRRVPSNPSLANLPSAAIDWLHDGCGGAWFFLESTPDSRAELWRKFEAELLTEHIEKYPGTRPLRWWEFNANGPRIRLGGIGTPCHERLAHGKHHVLGVPTPWITPGLARAYFRLESPLDVPAIDPADPPMYESEAAYLERLGLWLLGERKHVKEGFEPESVLDIFEFDPDDL